MAVVGIQGESNNNWIFLYNNVNFVATVFTDRKNRIVLFGNLPENKNIMFNNTTTSLTYETEDELETAVDTFVNEPGYYKSQAEASNPDKFSGESKKYSFIEPKPPELPKIDIDEPWNIKE